MTEMLSRLVSYRMSILSNQISRNVTSGAKQSVELAYSCFQPTKSPPKDPPLVILHGLFGSKRNWESLARAFSKTGRKVITVDARNHGESTHDADMHYMTMVEDVHKLLQRLDIPKAIILGHSMGGKTAMCLALTKPELVDTLIVEDVAPNSSRTSVGTTFPQYISAMKNVHFDSQVATLSQARRTADKQLHKAFPDTFIRAFILTNIRETAHGFEWKVNLDSIENNLDNLVGFPDVTGNYHGRTLFIGGKNSNHITSKDEPTIKTLFPNSRIEHIPGAGHWVHSEKPRELLEMVQKFINEKS